MTAIKYRAFLSYSHRDTAWARWLHRALEGHRIDKDLVGRETAYGPQEECDHDAFEAIHQACLQRFRPIMMTTMCALIDGLPLVFGQGAGSALRRPLGIAIVGGLLVSQFLTLYTTPVIYLYLDYLSGWLGGRRASDENQKLPKPAAKPA